LFHEDEHETTAPGLSSSQQRQRDTSPARAHATGSSEGEHSSNRRRRSSLEASLDHETHDLIRTGLRPHNYDSRRSSGHSHEERHALVAAATESPDSTEELKRIQKLAEMAEATNQMGQNRLNNGIMPIRGSLASNRSGSRHRGVSFGPVSPICISPCELACSLERCTSWEPAHTQAFLSSNSKRGSSKTLLRAGAGAGEDRFPPGPRTEAARQAVGRRAPLLTCSLDLALAGRFRRGLWIVGNSRLGGEAGGLRAGAGDMDKL